MKELLDILAKKQVYISVADNDLKVRFNGPQLSEEILREIRVNKQSIIDYLKNQSVYDKFTHIKAADKRFFYPLSSAQQRLWTLSQVEEGNVAYNVTGVCIFQGIIDMAALELSFNSMIERHEMLRTIFREDSEGKVMQIIQSPNEVQFKVTCADLDNVDQQEELVKSIVQAETVKPFDLARGPIFRATLLKLQPGKWVFSYSMHHIVSDGWSMGIFISELMMLYNAFINNEKNPLVPLNLHYKDYAVWQQEQLKSSLFEADKKYWLKQFEESLPILEFPADFTRPAIKTYNGDIVYRKVNKVITEQLKAFCQQQGGTLFMGILAVVNALLYRYTNQNDIIIGSPIAGREHSDLEGQIGFYVNTLALRTRLDGKMSFVDLFLDVKRITLEAYNHQSYPFDELIESLPSRWDLGRNPLFDVMVVLQNANIRGSEEVLTNRSELKISGYPGVKRVVSLFDLRFECVESNEGLNLSLEFNSDIYDRPRIEQLSLHFENIIRAVISSPNLPIGHLEYLDESERYRLLFGLNDTASPIPTDKTLIDLLEEQLSSNSERIAIVCDGRSFTYKELNERSNKLANFLVTKVNVQLEARVAILQQRSPEFLISALAVLKAGGAYVPLEVDIPEDRLLYMLDNVDAQVLLTEKSFIEFGNRLQWRTHALKYLICIDDDVYNMSSLDGHTEKDLWEHVGNIATDAISGGGWMSSYTGEYFSDAEMKEYTLNSYQKLKDHLTADMKVLEIGCASGLTMFKIAPTVSEYYGTDLSSSILETTRKTSEEKGYNNIFLSCYAAHEIDQLNQTDFDLIIINSVIHSFSGYNYLRNVLVKVIAKAKPQALLFLGDVMDENKRKELINDLELFRKNNQQLGYRTKTDWMAELFLSKDYLNDIISDNIGIVSASYSDKIYSIPNELTRYRFDALLMIDKTRSPLPTGYGKRKYQFGISHVATCSSSSPEILASNQNLAYVIFTSGSTGRPKGVMIEHLGMLNHLYAKIKALNMSEDSRVIQNASQSFDISVWQFFAVLLCGGKIFVYNNDVVLNMGLFIQSLKRDSPTILEVVPSYLSVLLDTIEEEFSDEKLESIEFLVVTGENLNPKLASRCFQVLSTKKMVNAYGPTEASDDITHHIFDGCDGVKRVPVGKVIQNLHIHILDDQLQPCPLGVKGEICVSGIGVGRGYINDEVRTKETFLEDPFRKGVRMYKTGDIGRFLHDGTIEFFGRKDSQVKIRGHRIELGEIESALLSHDEITSTAVIVLNDDLGEKQLVAYIVCGTSLDNLNLQSFLLKRLPRYMQPSHFVMIDKLPLTANGKIDRKRLPIPSEINKINESLRVAPRNDFEKRLAILWSDILNVDFEKIGVNDDFFDLGGHSLKATRLTSQIHREFNVKLQLKDLFRNGILEKQTRLIQNAKKDAFLNIKPISEAPSYPLSSSQQRLWMISQVEAGNIAYIMPGACTFEGSLDIEALDYAFDTMIARHESLRTVFGVDENGTAVQYIKKMEEVGFNIAYEFLSSLEESGQKLKNRIQESLTKPFVLEEGPLIKATLFQIAVDRWVFAFCMHHIISDGWSINIFINELLLLYNSKVKGQPNPLSALKLQYKDYASWQRQQIYGPSFNEDKAFWLSQFSGDLPVLELPADHNRPMIRNYSGSIITHAISTPVAREFQKLLDESKCTLFMGLLTAVNTLLYRYTGQEDIIIGSPIAGREHSDLEDQIGFYVNTLAIRTKLNGNDIFKDILGRVRETTLGAFEHQMYPFDELVQALNLRTDVSRNPLFDVMVVLQNTDDRRNDMTQALSGVKTGVYNDFHSTVSLFDLRFDFRETQGGLSVNIEYNTDIYDKWRVKQMAFHFEKIIEEVTKDSIVPIGLLNYMEDKERHKILHSFNNTLVPLPENKTLVDLFTDQVTKSPADIAIVFEERKLTYRELDEYSNRLARFLTSITSIRAEERVGILQSRGLDLTVSILGTLKSGGAYVPLDVDYPIDRLIYILKDSGIEILLAGKNHIELANKLQWRCDSLHHLVCIDSDNIFDEQGGEENTLMSEELWNSVGDTATDAISRGGWMSSYTGEYLSAEEMQEYSDNVYFKLRDHLHGDMKVLEIGCSSGLTMFRIAPHVGTYYGTDMSPSILSSTQEEASKLGYENVSLSCLPAHEIDQLSEQNFDLVIINSVVHCFKGHNYLRKVLVKSIGKVRSKGFLFLGDLMDEDKRDALQENMLTFKNSNLGKGYHTKTDWSKELFVSREYLDDLISDEIGITSINYSKKIHAIENELTRFRFDAFACIDKDAKNKEKHRNKYQYDLQSITLQPSNSLNYMIPVRNLAYVLYTSGSTGNPKGCMLEHRGIVNRLIWMWAQYKFNSSDIILQKTTFTFDVSVWELLMPICFGAKMVMCHKDDVGSPERIAHLIEKHKITCLHFVPSMLNVFMATMFNRQEISSQLNSLRLVIASGEALSVQSVIQWYEKCNAAIHNLYGPTEASIDVTHFTTSKKNKVIPIGKPIWNTEIYVLDGSSQLVPIGVLGELCISGVGLARGYLNQAQLTSQKFIENPFALKQKMYRTGDLGRWRQDGNIEFVGRKDDQIKIHGYRIELGEIEKAIQGHNDIEDAVVVARINQDGDKELVAYIISNVQLSPSDLRYSLLRILPTYMLPNHFVQMKEFPLTSSGKVSKKELPNPQGLGLTATEEYMPPRTELESKLAILWQEVLGKERISIRENFFELGGDSFKAIRLASRYGKQIAIIDLYKNPTVETLASYLEAGESNRLLQPLTEACGTEKISIIIFPYAAGDPVVYRNLATAFGKNSEFGVYCVRLPRYEKWENSVKDILLSVADEIEKEIKAKIRTPVLLHGECIGAGLALKVAEGLQQNDSVKVIGISLAGILARQKVGIALKDDGKNELLLRFFKKLGATLPLNQEDREAFSKNALFDGALSIEAFNDFIYRMKYNDFIKLTTPIYCLVGDKDPMTRRFRTKYKKWQAYAHATELVVFKDVGHYISRDKYNELAYTLAQIALGQPQKVCERQLGPKENRLTSFLKDLIGI